MKKIATALLVTGTLLIGLLFFLPQLISTDWARQELSRQLSSASGMTIGLNGPVKLSFLPQVAIVAEDISLAGEEDAVSVSVPRFSTAITLTSLWSDKLEIRALTLVEPAISLQSTVQADEPSDVADQAQTDPFAAIVETLERLAVNRISIENGRLVSGDAAGTITAVEAIDVDLSVPDLDREARFSLAATHDGRRVEVTGSLSALRPVLQRQPADIAISAQVEPSPAPELSSLSATGQIRLNENGSYQIRDGLFSVGEQGFRLDALFVPGERPRFLADLTAERIDLGSLALPGPAGAETDMSAASTDEIDLAFLSDLDVDISVAIEELTGGRIKASDVAFTAGLRDGALEARLDHLGLEAGSLAATASTNVRQAPPVIEGRIVSSGLDVAAMAELVGQAAPLSGKLTLEAAYAFRGLSSQSIRSSANMRGTIGIREGTIPLAGLLQGSLAQDITGLNVDLRIDDIAEPVELTGEFVWRGQGVALQAQVAAHSFLSQPSIGQASGPVSLAIRSRHLEASADGVAGGDGSFKGRVKAASPSVDELLRWLGQTGSDSLQRLAFDGAVDADPDRFSFSDAALALNGIEGFGHGSIRLQPSLGIQASLGFGELDFAALTGGGQSAAEREVNQAAGGDIPIDLSFLKGLEAKVAIEADRIGYGKVHAGPLATNLTIADGKAHLIVPQAPFYEGTIAAEMVADGSADTPSIALDATIAGATATGLLRDAARFDRIEGTLDTTVSISGSGGTTTSLARALDGSVSLKISDGALRGINIAEAYNSLVALLSDGFQQDETKKTTFTELGASFDIDDGIARTSDINLLGPLVRMDGAGQIDLAEQSLQIRLNPRIVASLTGQGGDIAAEGIGVPVVVEGALGNPRIYPDLSSLMKDPKGAIEALGRLGLPTDKLGLDRLIPGQLPSSSGIGGSGAADIIGDLINKNVPEGRGGGELTNIIGDLLSGDDQNTDQPEAKQTGARDAAKAIIGDLIGRNTSRPDTSSDAQETAVSGQDNGTLVDPVPEPDRQDGDIGEVFEPAFLEPGKSPQGPEKGEIGTLLDRLLQ